MYKPTTVDLPEQGNRTEIVSLYHIAETQCCVEGFCSTAGFDLGAGMF